MAASFKSRSAKDISSSAAVTLSAAPFFQGRWCFGKTPMQTFVDAMPMTKEKMIAA
jgi:hypothetical protein